MADVNVYPEKLEGEPYGTIEFKIDVNGRNPETHEFDINLATPLISGLKDDYAEIFGIPGEKQIWYYNNEQLTDANTLWDSGLQCQDDVMYITVRVA